MKKSSFLFVALPLLVILGISLFPPTRLAHAQSGTVGLGTNGFSCVVTVSTATTIQAVGGSCVAPGAALRLYITDVTFAANAGAIAADTFPTLKTGTGGTCGSNTAVVWEAFTTAATQQTIVQDFTTPIRLPLNQELCWIDSTAGSKTLIVNGYIAP